MVTLHQISAGLRADASGDLAAIAIDVTHDSRRVGTGSLFVAVTGLRHDGNTFVSDAMAAGAVGVVSEQPRPENFKGAWLQVSDARRALPRAAAIVFGRPSEWLRLVGVTGTNGKTTTAYLVDRIIREEEGTSALLGTVAYRVGRKTVKAERTTPEAADIQRILRSAVNEGCYSAVMEVSSHAIELGRVDGLRFEVAVFTNLTQDHLDYHGTMEEYFAAKRKFFEGTVCPCPRWAVVNADDAYGQRLANEHEGPILRFGTSRMSDVRAEKFELSLDGLRMDVATPIGPLEIRSPLVGRPYVYNILAATSAALSLGFSTETIARALRNCAGAPGRFERIAHTGGFAVVVDYAHSDDALTKVLETARELTEGRVITLFGCGGDRDRTKRAPMGKAAGAGSDIAILTSDNPRSEDPLQIIADAEVGLKSAGAMYETIPDRREAIHRAIAIAVPGDVVVIAGKGHEDYQIFADRTIHFDDREVAREALDARGLGVGALK
ncbi:MAG TPA: UDP-N-acetylmuramoyl-L-alanyl-D-glutamate--2,6-diaminopimelate ligase [Blastocatellia bacterium]|nr:UDP-N-acetylmuramoyl-L-alanyl-D-glutamate--2,6-diaminopimelate ligase [Blastocatellia bacterium]